MMYLVALRNSADPGFQLGHLLVGNWKRLNVRVAHDGSELALVSGTSLKCMIRSGK